MASVVSLCLAHYLRPIPMLPSMDLLPHTQIAPLVFEPFYPLLTNDPIRRPCLLSSMRRTQIWQGLLRGLNLHPLGRHNKESHNPTHSSPSFFTFVPVKRGRSPIGYFPRTFLYLVKLLAHSFYIGVILLPFQLCCSLLVNYGYAIGV